MTSLKRLFSAAPEGTAALFFIQIFATLGFAVLYSTLVLYATKHLQLSVKVATTLMGVFGAFNYGLHLFGGYLGGRFLSNRNLFVGGMALQVIGCGCIAARHGRDVLCRPRPFPHRQRPQRHLHQHDAHAALHPGGSAPRRRLPLELRRHERRLLRRVQRRRSISRRPRAIESLHLRDARQLSSPSSSPLFTWKTLADRNTPLLDATPKQFRLRQLAGIAILIALVPGRVVHAPAARQDRDDNQGDLRRGRAHADLPHAPPPGSPRAAEHDGLPDSDDRLADVLVACTRWRRTA